jgi:hypothetical protein
LSAVYEWLNTGHVETHAGRVVVDAIALGAELRRISEKEMMWK